MLLLIFPTEAYMLKNYGLALTFFTPLIMLMLELASGESSAGKIWERAAGNLLGVGIGLCFVFLAAGKAGRHSRMKCKHSVETLNED